LLHGNGTNGAQNNTFLDSSSNNFTITRNGNTTQGTFSPFSVGAGYWSNYFDGSGDYLTLPSSSNLAMGTGDFCIEMFVFPGSSSTQNLFTNANSSTGGDTGLGIFIRNTTQVRLASWNTAFLDTGSNAIVTNQWNHVAVCRSGTTASIFVNGTRQATGTVSNNFSSTNAFYVGTAVSGGDQLTGYISNLRAVKGSAVNDPSQTSITVPTAPLTAITNTQLLTCQDNRFRDASGNTFTITVSGNTSVQAFSPFAPTAAYSASTVGGSGYFDGTGDNLSIANNAAFQFGSGDFTVEAWVYAPSNPPNIGSIVSHSDGASASGTQFLVRTEGSNTSVVAAVYSGGTAYVATWSSALPIGQWNHVAFTRSGTSTYLWVNGVQRATASVGSVSLNTTSTALTIGSNASASADNWLGYISGTRITKGAALYTATFTPPTAPPTTTVSSGTVGLLLNYTNAAIIDNTAKNVLETVGNAQISTSVSKFGGGSMAFDGSGDYLVSAAGNTYISGTENFTIEGWLNLNSISSTQTIVSGNTSNSLFLRYGQGYTVTQGLNIGRQSVADCEYCAFTFATGTWYHIAVCRSNGVIYFFVNGTQQTTQGSGAASYSFPVTTTYNVGFYGVEPLNGYIDDFRITKGIARYTSNFTPQTSQWQDQ
jgi:hypothetical protein